MGKQLYFENEFKRFGVRVEYVLEEYDDTPEGQLSKNVRAIIAEYERTKIKERMARGRDAKVRAGGVIVGGGNAPFGYKLDENDRLVIDESEKRIVSLIFQWYVNEDQTLQGIATKLNEMGVPLPGKGNCHRARRVSNTWTHTTVRFIIKNETYAGVWHYGKNTDREVIPNKAPMIISRSAFDLAQNKLEQNKKLASRNRKYDYLLSGFAVCGFCNASISGKTTTKNGRISGQSYGCNARRSKKLYKRACNLPYFSMKKVDTKIWDWLKELISNPTRLKSKLHEYQANQDEAYLPIKERLETIEALLHKNQKKRSHWLELYTDGEISKDELKDKKLPLDRILADLRAQRVKLKADLEQGTITDEFIEDVLEFASKVRGKLDLMDSDCEEKRWLLKALRVNVIFTKENNERLIEVSCRVGKEKMSIDVNRLRQSTRVY